MDPFGLLGNDLGGGGGAPYIPPDIDYGGGAGAGGIFGGGGGGGGGFGGGGGGGGGGGDAGLAAAMRESKIERLRAILGNEYTVDACRRCLQDHGDDVNRTVEVRLIG